MAVTDTGAELMNRIARETRAFQELAVYVGVQGAEGADVVEYAIINEFGSESVEDHPPARPFLRTAIDTNRDAFDRQQEKEWGRILDGKSTGLEAASRLGLFGVQLVRKRIRDATSWARPNAASTIEQKGSSSPLIDDGRLIQSITYQVRKGDQVVESGGA